MSYACHLSLAKALGELRQNGNWVISSAAAFAVTEENPEV
jgi:hypothetical protein